MKLDNILRSMSKNEPLSCDEIGELLGLSRQCVDQIVRRALSKMRQRLRAMGVEDV
jgi:DNA-directed RNA polymerase specialized sigma subunit